MASHLALTLNRRKDVCAARAIRCWHRLPLSWETLKARLEVTLSTLVWVAPEDAQGCPQLQPLCDPEMVLGSECGSHIPDFSGNLY